MKEEHRINIILKAKKIMSVNALYGAKISYVNGRPVAQMYKKADAKTMEHYIGEQIKLLDIPNNYPWVNKNTKFKMTFTAVFNTGFYSRDIDNCCKNLIDGIFRALDINDSHIISLSADKKYLPGIKDEKILVMLEEVSDDDIRMDQLPKPHIIWINDSSIDLKIPNLPPKCPKKDKIYRTEDKDRSDTRLYILRPETFNYNTTMKVAFDIDENILSSKGFTYIAIIGSESDWGDKWNDIVEFKELVKNIHDNTYSGIRLNSFNNINDDILNWVEK